MPQTVRKNLSQNYSMDNQIKARLQKAVNDKVFPGCVLGVVTKDDKRKIYSVGTLTYDADSPAVKGDTIYDVASITKAIPGGAVLLKLIDEGKLGLGDRLVDYIPEFGNFENKKEVLIRHILTYTLDLDVPPMSTLKDKSAEEITRLIIESPLKSLPGTKYLYTNATAFFIGFIVEKVTGQKIDELANEYFFRPLQMNRTTFHPNKFPKNEIAPTEIDDWRGGVVHGEVHDESTYVLRNKYIVSIAGLFSTAPDLLNFQEMLLNRGSYKGKKYFSPEIVKDMHTNQIADIGQYEGLGWELNAPIYMGNFSHERMFGKTGFTGCLVLTDPIKGVGFTLLSNRTYPKRPLDSSAINEVRRDIANIVFGSKY